MANVDEPGRCQACGRALPVQQGSGRKRRYCDDTCRSAGRRRRAAGSASTADTRATQPAETLSVNKSLTTRSRQSIVDNVPEQPAALAAIDRAQALARN